MTYAIVTSALSRTVVWKSLAGKLLNRKCTHDITFVRADAMLVQVLKQSTMNLPTLIRKRVKDGRCFIVSILRNLMNGKILGRNVSIHVGERKKADPMRIESIAHLYKSPTGPTRAESVFIPQSIVTYLHINLGHGMRIVRLRGWNRLNWVLWTASEKILTDWFCDISDRRPSPSVHQDSLESQGSTRSSTLSLFLT